MATSSIDGVATAASFNRPDGIISVGTNLYVADTYNNKIRKIVRSTGAVSTVAGDGTSNYTDGIGVAASFKSLSSITSDGANLYVSDSYYPKIRKIVIATREVTTLAGGGVGGPVDGIGTSASFGTIKGLTNDGIYLYVVDSTLVRRVNINSGVVTTLAVNLPAGSGIAMDRENLYVTDPDNHKIYKIVISTGVFTTLAGSGSSGFIDGAGAGASFSLPTGITCDGINLYITDTNNHSIRKIAINSGVVTTVAGNGTQGMVDGIGAASTFNYPNGVTNDGVSLYVADTGNHKIRNIQ